MSTKDARDTYANKHMYVHTTLLRLQKCIASQKCFPGRFSRAEP